MSLRVRSPRDPTVRLNSPQMHDIVSGSANGTTVNLLAIDAVQEPEIIVPPQALVKAFDGLATQVEKCREEMMESCTLALCDTLLAKLISGKIRIKDAEKLVEAEAAV